MSENPDLALKVDVGNIMALATEALFGLEARRVLKALVEKLHQLHKDQRYISVFMVAQDRVGPYGGTTYTAELDAADALLQKWEKAASLDGGEVIQETISGGKTMAVKCLTPEQCQYLHQKFPPPDCCLCNAKDEIARLEAALFVVRKEVEQLKNKIVPDYGDPACKFEPYCENELPEAETDIAATQEELVGFSPVPDWLDEVINRDPSSPLTEGQVERLLKLNTEAHAGREAREALGETCVALRRILAEMGVDPKLVYPDAKAALDRGEAALQRMRGR